VAKILLVEDDQQLSFLMRDSLVSEHHSVEISADGEDAMNRLKLYAYDAIILDWALPKLSGLDVLKRFRAESGATPILMLTGRDAISDKEAGFEAGADDYLTKPFDMRELQARVKALLRRPTILIGDVLKFDELLLDRSAYIVKRGEKDIALLPKEFALLEFFMRNPNRVFTTQALLNHVWADESDATAAAVTTCIKRLRQKIDVEGEPSLICTVHGVGYKLARAT
jgi:DNA-binding response OmpR family regulator